MNLKKWLKGATRIRIDDRTLGNLLKNGAVGAGTVVGGPLGLAIGGVGSAAGQAALPGANFGDIVGAGVKGAGTTGALQATKGVLSSALDRGAAAGVPSPSVSAAADTVPSGGLSLPSVPNLTTAAEKAVDPRGFLTRALDTGKDVAGWAVKHPEASSKALSAFGDALDPTDEQLNREQARRLALQTEMDEYDLQRKKASDAALEPLRQALYGGLGSQIATNYSQIAKNPYWGG